MALNLIKAGYDLYVNDINKEAVEEVSSKGAVVCETISDITEHCEVIVTMLPNGIIVEDVLFREGGLYEAANSGTLIIDMSSISPIEAKSFADKCSDKGIRYMDAPVSGGEPKAIDGTMVIMAGGLEEDFEQALPLFDVMGGNVVHMGIVGTGSATKLANQIMVSVHLAALSEAAIFASKSGIDLKKMHQAIGTGLAASAVMDAKIPMIVNRDFEPGGKMATNFKDLRNIKAAADGLGLPLPVTSLVEELFRTEIANGNEHKDHSFLLNYYERNANHIVESE